MPGKLFKLLSFLVCFLCTAITKGQVISNQGTDFWTVFPTHVPTITPDDGILLANISIFITSGEASSGKVSVGNFTQTFTVAANTVTEIKIPRAEAYIDETESGQILTNRGIHILVDPGQPKVVTYAHIFAGERSAASLVLPVEVLGKEYYSLNYPEVADEGKNFIVVIASQPNTKILLKKGNTELIPGGIILSQAGDVYEYLSGDDLTGVSVRSATSDCNSFAVFSGSSGVRILPNTCNIAASFDPLYQQCYPVESWGLNYGYVPFSTKSPNQADPVRTKGQIIRVLAKDNATAVSINGVLVGTLNTGEFYTTPIPLAAPAFITATKPISVAQYSLSQICSGGTGYGDPDMVILNPIEYNIKDITVYSSPFEKIKEQYVNILIKNAGISSFRINGAPPTSSFTSMATLPGYSYLQLNLNSYNTFNFRITSNEGFNAIAYGFGDVESYAYSAGTNLAASYAISAVRNSDKQVIESACQNEDYFFKLTLPFIANKITWQMDVTEIPTTQNNPVVKTVFVNGIRFYEYTFPKTPAYAISGLHKIKINATYPSSDCTGSGQLQINNEFTVYPFPNAEFTFAQSGCGNTFKFEDKYTGGTDAGLTWLWDFGDGVTNPGNNTSTLKNPTHTYNAPGEYTVKLTIGNNSECIASKDHKVNVLNITTANFNSTALKCIGKPVVFTEVSILNGFVPVKWEWDFGDNEFVTKSNNSPASHTYLTSGTFKVKLTLTNTAGCTAVVMKDITINPLPATDFTVAEVCAGEQATFVNKTPTIAGVKYLWDFGDVNAVPANSNTSTLENPQHRYNVDGEYEVSLTATFLNGCGYSITKKLRVHSDNIVADFEIPSTVCSGQSVAFKNISAINGFGVINKLEWYFDADNDPGNNLVIPNPIPGNLYNHTFPLLPINVPEKTYKVKLKVFTSGGCGNEVTKDITVYALPKTTFETIPDICINSIPLQITQGKEITGIAGSGVYTGAGISGTGFFDPVIAGKGTHSLKYKFTSTIGCDDSALQNITVYDQPVITLEPVIDLLEGSSITLQPNIQGNDLTYLWSPADDLSNPTIANPVASPMESKTYSLTVSNKECSTTTNIKINVYKGIKTYNTFTPNGDGVNDTWNISNLNTYPAAVVEIFNRYGSKLFHSVGYNIPWDGRYNGSDVPAGTYYYIINPGKGVATLSGFITVVR